MMNLKTLLRTAKQRQQQEEGHQLTKEKLKDPPLPSSPPLLTTFPSLPPVALSPPPPLSPSHEIHSPYPRCFYIPQWCSIDDEQQLITSCQSYLPSQWVTLKGRRLLMFGDTPPPSPPTPPLPPWLLSVTSRVSSSGLFTTSSLLPALPPPNHVLINQYEAGQGIMAHKDGPAYHPLVVIVSLGSSCVMHFYRQPPPSSECGGQGEGAALSVFLGRRSLLIFSEVLYEEMYHTIHECKEDVLREEVKNCEMGDGLESEGYGRVIERGTRYSLTIRASRTDR